MSTDLYHVVYLSSASHLLSDDELRAILSVSRRNNRERGITGMLLYSDGGFIQALEGPRDEVDALYKTIARDPRHGRIITLLEGPIDARNFPQWTMGFQHVDADDPDLPGFTHFFDEPTPHDEARRLLPRPIELLLSFKETSTPQKPSPTRYRSGPGTKLV
jgi:hypothetical protein